MTVANLHGKIFTMDQFGKTVREMGLTEAQVTCLHKLVAPGPGYHQCHDRDACTILARLGLVDDLDAVTFGCNWWAMTPRGRWVAAVLQKESV